MRHGDVPLPKLVENYDDVSEEDKEDVKPQVAHEKAKVNKKDGKAKAMKKNRAQKKRDLRTALKKLRRR